MGALLPCTFPFHSSSPLGAGGKEWFSSQGSCRWVPGRCPGQVHTEGAHQHCTHPSLHPCALLGAPGALPGPHLHHGINVRGVLGGASTGRVLQRQRTCLWQAGSTKRFARFCLIFLIDIQENIKVTDTKIGVCPLLCVMTWLWDGWEWLVKFWWHFILYRVEMLSYWSCRGFLFGSFSLLAFLFTLSICPMVWVSCSCYLF